MQPEIELFGLTLYTFGMMVALAFIAAAWVAKRRLEELGKPTDWSFELVLYALVGGVLGAKLWWLAEEWQSVGEDPLAGLVSPVGLVWYGGLLGGAAAVLLWTRRRRADPRMVADLVAPALALGYAIGRIGCQLAGDGDYGVPSDVPWAMAYPDGTVPTTEEVHPTPVYETLAMAGVAGVLWRLRDSTAPGGLFALYLVLAGLERFLVEFVRRNEAVALGLSLAQFVSLAMVAAGAAWLLSLHRAAPGRAGSGREMAVAGRGRR